MVRRAPGDSFEMTEGLRRAVYVVALLNLVYFGVEFTVAYEIGSVSLLADSVDFLEDASFNILILLALRWPRKVRARVGMMLAALLLVPAAATLWMVWTKIMTPVAPSPLTLTLTALGALAVNLTCSILLLRHRDHKDSLVKAAFLFSRDDAFANLAIMLSGVVTAFLWRSAWPDVIVGLCIAAMNADAAFTIWKAARAEGSAKPAA